MTSSYVAIELGVYIWNMIWIGVDNDFCQKRDDYPMISTSAIVANEKYWWLVSRVTKLHYSPQREYYLISSKSLMYLNVGDTTIIPTNTSFRHYFAHYHFVVLLWRNENTYRDAILSDSSLGVSKDSSSTCGFPPPSSYHLSLIIIESDLVRYHKPSCKQWYMIQHIRCVICDLSLCTAASPAITLF